MGAGERKRILELPIKLILTQEGSTFFIKQNKKLLRFSLAGNVEEYGISMETFTPDSVQRLVLANYISKVEIARPELASSRQEVMDLSKLLVYSLLYKQYDAFIFKEMLNSDAIKKWNRLNPLNIIDEKTNINEQFLEKVLRKNEHLIYDTKQEVLAPFYAFITKTTTLDPEEKNLQLFLSEKFLNNLRPFIWFIITKFKDAPHFDSLIRTIRSSLIEYMDKTKIAEYISLMLMELILSAGNINMRTEAKLQFPNLKDPQEALVDPKIRQHLVNELQRKGDMVFVSWKLGGGSVTSIGTQGKLQIEVYNKRKCDDAMKINFNDKKQADITRNSLSDFYRALPEGSDPTSLGLYYISYLNDACEKVNIRFESSVNRYDADSTVITLYFMF